MRAAPSLPLGAPGGLLDRLDRLEAKLTREERYQVAIGEGWGSGLVLMPTEGELASYVAALEARAGAARPPVSP